MIKAMREEFDQMFRLLPDGKGKWKDNPKAHLTTTSRRVLVSEDPDRNY